MVPAAILDPARRLWLVATWPLRMLGRAVALPFRNGRAVWLVPFFVFFFSGPASARRFLVLVLGILLLILVSRHPVGALNWLLLVIPFSTFMIAFLFRVGVPAAIVRPLGQWKELLIGGMVLAAIQRFRKSGRRLDVLDRVALGFVALGTAYLVLPALFVGDTVGAHLSLTARELGWRGDVLYVLLFVACRHLMLSAQAIEKLLRRVLAAGAVVAGLGLFEFFFSSFWNKIATQWFAVPRYLYVVLGVHPTGFRLDDVRNFGTIAGHQYVRIGSVFLNFLAIGFYLAICLGIAAELIARGRARPWVYVSVPLIGTALLMSQTRSAIIAGVIALLVALRPQIGRITEARIRFGIVLGALAILIFPVILLTRVGARFTGDSSSNKDHRSAYSQGVALVQKYPMGRGLATSAGGGQLVSFSSQSGDLGNVVITESQYLQVGTQLGVLAMGGYVLLFILVIHHLRRSPRDDEDVGYASPGAMRNAMIALALGGLFLQPFVSFAVAWTLWGLAGAAASVVDRAREETAYVAIAR